MTTGDQGMVDDEGYITFVGRDDESSRRPATASARARSRTA